ncbi:MAG TPA: hemolysin family protein [candidate division Zixibacteria bacterium]|jgi:putative hemolysin
MTIGGELALIALLILCNGFFAGAEAALIAVRQTRVNELAAKSGIAGRALQKLKQQPERFLATVQVGITLVGTLASVVSGATVVVALEPRIAAWPLKLAQRWPEQIAIGIVVAAISLASLIFGELVPKYIALAHPGRVALFAARPIAILSRLGHPLVVVLSATARLVARLFGLNPTTRATGVSDQEIRLLVMEGSLHGSIDDVEHEMIHQTLDFSETKARQVMTPRTDIAAIDTAMTVEGMLQFIREEAYSRYPVYTETIDKIRGVLFTKDVIHLLTQGSPIILHDLIRSVQFVPDSMSISKVLAIFQAERRHIAIVLDEFGGTAGLITLEDVVEEIVGDIQDEYDAEPESYRRLDDGTALVAAETAVIDFNEHFGCALPTDRGDTLGGLFVTTLDRVPHRGDRIELAGVQLDLVTLHGHRIKRLRARHVNRPC